MAKTNKIRARLAGLIGANRLKKIHHYVTSVMFARSYALAGLLILIATTVFWTILGAKLQQNNADQLVNPYLFQTDSTFKNAFIPSAHSFLIKWPVFWLIKMFGFTSGAYINATVIVVLLTVLGLAAVLYVIDRRPLVFGTTCLALASVLLLVPTSPASGALLPVNMAMLATRNLEYLLFIASLMLLTKNFRIRSWSFWISVILLGLLIASDKLFFTLTIGGAILGLIVYGLSSGWNLVSMSARWVVAGLAEGAAAVGFLWWLNMKAITHITTQASVSPYHLIHNAKQLALGLIYGFLGLLTNFGANPANQTSVLRDVPREILKNLASTSGPAYVINLVIFLLALYGGVMIIRLSLAHNKDRAIGLSHPARLSIALIWTAAAAFGAFIITDHYYAGDARYLTIVLFSLFVAGVTYFSQKQWSPERYLLAGLVMTVGIALALPHLVNSYRQSQAVFAPIQKRNKLIVQALAQHKVDTLVGDYWRVLPIKNDTGGKLSVTPMAGCSQPRTALSSKLWQPDLNNRSFAYLLSLDGSLTDFPRCSVNDVIAAYGRPNASVVISGTLAKPTEMLLFYDRGANKSAPVIRLSTPSTVLPIELEDLPLTNCKAPTIMNIVAHEDDDLLFMSPDLLRDIDAGHCIRTVYMTAGDAGAGYFYWLGRERATEAAYSRMLNFKDIWVERIVRIADNRYATIASPRGNSAKISLIFLRLPDGNLKGQGFAGDKYQSLASLDANKISSMDTVYSGSTYSHEQLVGALEALMQTYQPSEIRTLSNLTSASYPDHSDHMAVGRLTKEAYEKYETARYENKITIPLKFYVGYPINQYPANVSGDDLRRKEQAFSDYTALDPATCQTIARCERDPAYGAYLPRQYQNSY